MLYLYFDTSCLKSVIFPHWTYIRSGTTLEQGSVAEWSRRVEHICFTRTSGGSSHRWNVPSLQVHLFANEYVTRRFISGCSQKPNASSGVLAHPVIRLLGASCKICSGSQPVHIKSSWSMQKQPTAPSLDESWNHFCSVEAAGLRAWVSVILRRP